MEVHDALEPRHVHLIVVADGRCRATLRVRVDVRAANVAVEDLLGDRVELGADVGDPGGELSCGPLQSMKINVGLPFYLPYVMMKAKTLENSTKRHF